MKWRVLIGCLLFLSGVSSLAGQKPFFRDYSVKDPDFPGIFETIYQGADRQLYFGAGQGLFSFDGFDFEKMDSVTAGVTTIFETRQKQLWVGLANGQLYYRETGKFQAFDLPIPDSIQYAISGMTEDQNGALWIATYGAGLIRIVEDSTAVYGKTEGLFSLDIYDICLDASGRIWLATDGGVDICQLQGKNLDVQLIQKSDGLPDDIVRTLKPDSLGNIWVGTYEGGFCKYDIQLNSFWTPIDQWDHGVIQSLCIIEGNELWIGTDGAGLWRYLINENRLVQINGPDELSRSKIYDLLKDAEGNVWVLSSQNGILSANRQFEYQDVELENSQTILVDRNDCLWLGCQDGLYKLNKSSNKFESVFPKTPMNVVSLYEDTYGVIWIGTFGDGLILFDPVSKDRKLITEGDGLANGSILSIDGTSEKTWLATLGGVSEIDNGRNLFGQEKLTIFNFDHDSGLGTNFIYQVFVDSKKRVWFATDGQGLCLLENGAIICYNQAIIGKDTLPIRNVYSITEDKEGGIWFSTPNEGIFHLGNNGFDLLNRKAGLRDLAITGLTADRNGNILIMHASGIDLLNPIDHHIIYYGEEIGILNFDPNLNAFAQNKAGDIWFANSKTLVRYTPMQEELVIHPKSKITCVSVSLELVDFEKTNVFSYTQNQFIISYSGLWYTDPRAVRFRYKMLGFDEDWIYTKDHEVTYSSLPPGSYSFMVMSTENEVFDNEPVVEYQFTILPPFWLRWWFILISILVSGILAYLWIRERDKRKQRINQLQKDRIQSQLNALKSQINPHFLFNSFNTLIAIIEDDQLAAVKYVETLADFYRSLLQYREQEVITLKEELKLVEDYLFLLKMRYGENLQMDFEIDYPKVFLAPLTLQMLVENAVKHNVISSQRPLKIRIFGEGKFIVVQNNLQPKFRQEKSTGFGLNTLKTQYLKLSGKPLLIETDANMFTVKVPILNESGNAPLNTEL
ncbi:MAG: histidine kinase [Saprospiraceae bacterium]|nr:histidine kinase [Saprospiraceae bacterium]